MNAPLRLYVESSQFTGPYDARINSSLRPMLAFLHICLHSGEGGDHGTAGFYAAGFRAARCRAAGDRAVDALWLRRLRGYANP